MKKIVKCFIVLSMVFPCSCMNEKSGIQTISENDFQELVKLEEDRKPTKEILSIRNFFVQDSFLIINNSRKDSLFMVFDMNTFDCVLSWGFKGRGPDEYGTFTHLMDISSEKFQVADFSRFKIRTYNIPEFKLETEQEIYYGRNEPQIREIPQKIVTSDGILYFYDNFIKHELFITKWENGDSPFVINSFDSLKELYKSSFTISGCLALNSSMNRLVYAHRYIRRFDIMNFQGKVIKTVEIMPAPPPPIEHGENFDIEISVMCYRGVRAFNNSFFLYYVGHSQKELLDNEMTMSYYIEEYDWDGNPIKRYELNRYISDFDIVRNEEELMSFIGIDEINEDPLIIFKEKQ